MAKRKPAKVATIQRDDHNLNEYAAAVELGMSVAWLRRKRLSGTAGTGDAGPPYYKIDSKVIYCRADLRAYKEARKVDRSKNALPDDTASSAN